MRPMGYVTVTGAQRESAESSASMLEFTEMGFTERLQEEERLESFSMLRFLLLLCGMDWKEVIMGKGF